MIKELNANLRDTTEDPEGTKITLI